MKHYDCVHEDGAGLRVDDQIVTDKLARPGVWITYLDPGLRVDDQIVTDKLARPGVWITYLDPKGEEFYVLLSIEDTQDLVQHLTETLEAHYARA
jgi:hypothetical protein